MIAKEELMTYPERKQLIIQTLEEFRGDDREDMDPAKTADFIYAIIKGYVKKCCLCGHQGVDVTRCHTYQENGKPITEPCCSDMVQCQERMLKNEEVSGR